MASTATLEHDRLSAYSNLEPNLTKLTLPFLKSIASHLRLRITSGMAKALIIKKIDDEVKRLFTENGLGLKDPSYHAAALKINQAYRTRVTSWTVISLLLPTDASMPAPPVPACTTSSAASSSTHSGIPGEYGKCICTAFTTKRIKQSRSCSACPAKFHLPCHRLLNAHSTVPWYCPQCRSKHLDPFFHVLKAIQEPSIVINRQSGHGQISFTLTPEELAEYKSSSGKKVIQLHSVLANARGYEYGLEWPNYVEVKVNHVSFSVVQKNTKASQFNYNKLLRELPVNITKKCHVGVNQIVISSSDARPYMISVQKIQIRGLDELIMLVKQQSQGLDFPKAKEMVVKNFNGDDDDVQATSTVLSLSCPLGLCRLTLPARGRKCSHIQCFDLRTFLTFNRNCTSKAWQCTVCHKFIEFKDMFIDPYFMKILEDASTDEDLDEVEVLPDGSWKKKSSNENNNSGEQMKPEHDPMDLYDEDLEPKTVEIDLTLSSDEEGDALSSSLAAASSSSSINTVTAPTVPPAAIHNEPLIDDISSTMVSLPGTTTTIDPQASLDLMGLGHLLADPASGASESTIASTLTVPTLTSASTYTTHRKRTQDEQGQNVPIRQKTGNNSVAPVIVVDLFSDSEEEV